MDGDAWRRATSPTTATNARRCASGRVKRRGRYRRTSCPSRRCRLRGSLGRGSCWPCWPLVPSAGGTADHLYTLGYESTDDAFIAGHVVPISSRVAGHVAKEGVRVTDNEAVKEGELLVELDPRDFEAKLAAAEAGLQAAKAGQRSPDLRRRRDRDHFVGGHGRGGGGRARGGGRGGRGPGRGRHGRESAGRRPRPVDGRQGRLGAGPFRKCGRPRPGIN